MIVSLLAAMLLVPVVDYPMADAAMQGDMVQMRRLLADNVDVNQAQGDGSTALHWACGYGRRETAELLIAKGADVNAAEGGFGRTPLHWASIRGHKEVVSLLLEKGADLEPRDGEDRTPLDLALDRNHKDITGLLKK